MNATDVYVEQLIIGGLVAAIAAVLWSGVPPPVTSDAATIAISVAIAYLAGLIYDRIGDTLLERIEKRQRLELASKTPAKDGNDPYPENLYRARVYSQGDEVARQYNYLRTRLRLTRAVASLLPAATVALVVNRSGVAGWLVAFDVIAAYALVATINAVSPDLPRTDEPAFARYESNWWTAYASSIAGLLALIALMIVLASDATAYAVIAAGVASTILAGWVWLRIDKTLLDFLRDNGKP